jgi:hypothetical protein
MCPQISKMSIFPSYDSDRALILETLEQARWVVGGPHGAAAKTRVEENHTDRHHEKGDAAAKARLTEKQYRAQLRRAYVQLDSFRLQDGTPASHGAQQSAPTWERKYELVEMDSCLLV